MAAPMFHENRSKASSKDNNVSEEAEDPVDKMIRKTGCLQHHYDVQHCIAEKQDWRLCQDKVQIFRKCMFEYEKMKSTET